MKIYIIHSSDKEANYIDRILSAEQHLREEGHHVINPFPDQEGYISNKEMHFMHGHKMRDCDVAYAMEGWSKHEIGNAEMAGLMIHKKTIVFEK